MQRHHKRLRQLLGERQHVLAVAAAEDPVLVLEQDNVNVKPAKHPGSANIIPANRLGDRREQPPTLGTRRLIHHRHEIDAPHIRSPKQRGS